MSLAAWWSNTAMDCRFDLPPPSLGIFTSYLEYLSPGEPASFSSILVLPLNLSTLTHHHSAVFGTYTSKI
jgi:hypothetical protein